MKLKNLLWGLFFILIGALVFVNQLGYFSQISLLNLIITAFLIAIIIKSLPHLEFAGILFPLAIIGIIYSNELGINNLTPWPILTITLFVTIGLSLMFEPLKRHSCFKRKENFKEIINEEDEDEVTHSVKFGSSIKYINSENFKNAKISASFGALKIYFDNAKMLEDNATINLNVSFSGVEIYLPKEWRIINKVDISLGSVEDKVISNKVTTKTITLTGKVSLAGVEIIYI